MIIYIWLIGLTLAVVLLLFATSMIMDSQKLLNDQHEKLWKSLEEKKTKTKTKKKDSV